MIDALAIAPGAVHLKHYLSDKEQRIVAAECLELGARDAGFYTPIVRGGHPMSVRMLCLGRHWNARTYSYEETRSDIDGLPAPVLPEHLEGLARSAANEAGFTFAPDTCIVNWYRAASRMGLHQDKDESPQSIAEGAPVLSLSIGDTARFLFGGLRRRAPVQKILLESGDAFVFGGAARLRYHGVTRIEPGTAPPGLGFEGRLNLTFRKY
ncbi:MAG: alpha-ketoglutarate-dependent dioxygenase AlkB [Acidobacteria bacterium]|nr:alpha-ketoglutarate-dependent dioxygenase AlkB [Acidobacteriota bacterium]MCA1650078.1 alpha-ketoglutarate-dependent dioxygenase AlkB [Acidobacteriota bacterium]